MTKQANKAFSAFMKKQIEEKSSKKNLAKQANSVGKNFSQGKEEQKKSEEEMSEEEQLDEAKKASKGKAEQYNQSEMIKKLILQNILKYTLLIGSLVIFAIGLIKFGPAFFKMLNGLIYKILIGSLQAK